MLRGHGDDHGFKTKTGRSWGILGHLRPGLPLALGSVSIMDPMIAGPQQCLKDPIQALMTTFTQWRSLRGSPKLNAAPNEVSAHNIQD